MRLGHKITDINIKNRFDIPNCADCVGFVKADNRFFGGDSEEATPVPIPNTEVKLFSADGTAREAVWESRTLPKIFLSSPFPDYLGAG